MSRKERFKNAFPKIKDSAQLEYVESAFEDCPENVIALMEKHCKNVSLTPNTSGDTRYNSKENTVYMDINDLQEAEKNTGAKGYANMIIRHEFGHALDENMGKRGLFGRTPFSVSNPDFVKGLNDESKQGVKEFLKKSNDYFGKTETPCLPIADIFSALTSSPIRVSLNGEQFRTGHFKEYWEDNKINKNLEVFANLLALYSQKDKSGYNDAKRLFPSVTGAFEKAMEERGNNNAH